MTNKTWKFLSEGDIVDIIAPASHSPELKLEGGCQWLESLGLVPRVPKNLIRPDAFFASSLENQFEQLKSALYSDSKAIWCLRGGYGSMRLIPLLKKLKAPKRPKLFVGFSDITSLHLYFNQVWGWPTIHGRTISQLSPELAQTADRKLLGKMIFGKESELVFKNLRPLNEAAKMNKTISGKTVGGNLRILQSSIGTDWELKAKGKILFIEDVSERGYSIDRMLEQMFQAKLIDKGLKALVVGDFTEGKEKDGADLSDVALKRFASRVSYPVIRGLKCGHGSEYNYPLPFYTESQINLGTKISMTCGSGGE
jgi:muramoyltetrapeptide carboxypeptidase